MNDEPVFMVHASSMWIDEAWQYDDEEEDAVPYQVEPTLTWPVYLGAVALSAIIVATVLGAARLLLTILGL